MRQSTGVEWWCEDRASQMPSPTRTPCGTSCLSAKRSPWTSLRKPPTLLRLSMSWPPSSPPSFGCPAPSLAPLYASCVPPPLPHHKVLLGCLPPATKSFDRKYGIFYHYHKAQHTLSLPQRTGYSVIVTNDRVLCHHHQVQETLTFHQGPAPACFPCFLEQHASPLSELEFHSEEGAGLSWLSAGHSGG